MTASGNDNANANSNDIIFTIKGTKLYIPAVTLLARNNQNLSKLLSKAFKRSVYWFIRMNIKQKVRIKTQQMQIDVFSNQILLESIDYLF